MSSPVRRFTTLAAVATLGLITGLGGCKKKETTTAPPPSTETTPQAPTAGVRVTEVQLGTALGPDKRVQTPSDSFASKDTTIFASVATEGTSPAEITARWSFQDGQVVNETKRSITPSAKDVTEFSIQKPSGWPAGEYTLAILVDGKPVESKKFRVQ